MFYCFLLIKHFRGVTDDHVTSITLFIKHQIYQYWISVSVIDA